MSKGVFISKQGGRAACIAPWYCVNPQSQAMRASWCVRLLSLKDAFASRSREQLSWQS